MPEGWESCRAHVKKERAPDVMRSPYPVRREILPPAPDVKAAAVGREAWEEVFELEGWEALRMDGSC